MRKERDLIYELGNKNWLDATAGEAVVLGQTSMDPELAAQGTELARLIQEISFNDDRFSRVEGLAIDLIKRIEVIKTKEKACWFIDDLNKGEEKKRAPNEWEYDLIFCDNKYEIRMVLFKFLVGEEVVAEKEPVSSLLRDSMDGFDKYTKEVEETDFKTQIFRVTKYFDENGELRARIVDHDHEGGFFRGWLELYRYDDFASAWQAWLKLKSLVSRNS